MDPPFDASIISDLLLHVIGTNLAIYYANLLAFCLHQQKNIFKFESFVPLKSHFPVDNPVEIVNGIELVGSKSVININLNINYRKRIYVLR